VTTRRYLGSWTLPSGNSADVYLGPAGHLACEWDDPPSPTWPAEDVEHYERSDVPRDPPGRRHRDRPARDGSGAVSRWPTTPSGVPEVLRWNPRIGSTEAPALTR
jgi:hypothetical protein